VSLLGELARMKQFLGRRIGAQQGRRKMRLCETLWLGDRRFLALVIVEQQKFLVGGAGNSVALLAQLPPSPDNATEDPLRSTMP
jgi:flagellar biogenesis protein FliO